MFKYQLGEKLKKSQAEINKMSGIELRQWMAYFSLQNEEYKKSIENKELHRNLESMTDEERAAQQKSVFDKMDKMFKTKKK